MKKIYTATPPTIPGLDIWPCIILVTNRSSPKDKPTNATYPKEVVAPETERK